MKKGFTLAEVLITLGIIGVVAAITLPSLTAKYETLILSTQLKKDVSMLENTFKKMMADDDVDTMEYIKLLTLSNKTTSSGLFLSNYCGYFRDYDTYICKEIKNELKKYFNITGFINKKSKDYELQSNNYWRTALVFSLNTGERISIDFSTSGPTKQPYKDYYYIGIVQIDINGPKRPNKWGRDNFSFYIENDGKLSPKDPGGAYTYSQQDILNQKPSSCCSSSLGTFCVYYNNYNIVCPK